MHRLRDDAIASHHAGDLPAAEQRYRQVLASDPTDGASLNGLAVVLLQQGRDQDALTLLRQIIRQRPADVQCAQLMALTCRRLGLIDEGLQAAMLALRHGAEAAIGWLLLGSLQVLSGAYAESEVALRNALAIEADLAEAWHYLGIALHRQQRWGEARAAYQAAAGKLPYNPVLDYNLALCADAEGDLLIARSGFSRVRTRAPGRIDALARLANVQAMLCDFEGEAESVAALERRLASGDPLAADDRVEPFVLTFLPLSTQARTRILKRYTAHVRQEAAAVGSVQPSASIGSDGPLRLGYLSPDFGNHAVGGLVRDLFAAHDRDKVTVHAYSLRRHRDEVADTIRAGCDVFRDLENHPVRAIAQAIADDGIQVLIDLGGYTLGARPSVLALRPAAVQLAYLGFIHSCGAEWIDYHVLDQNVAPAGTEPQFSEPLLRMGGSMLPASRTLIGPVIPDRNAFGLPPDIPLFASFNNSYKLDPALLRAWVEISDRIPAARFVVYLLEHAHEGFMHAWQRFGGRCTAVQFVAKLPPALHARRAASCDLFLDAFRYQAGATGVAALEAGLPILACEGNTPVARLGAGLNRALGLEALIAEDSSAYVDRAVALAEDRVFLRQLRLEMSQNIEQCGFFSPRRGAAALETLASKAWNQHLEKSRSSNLMA